MLMLFRKNQLSTYDTFSTDLIQYKGYWVAVCRISSIDLDMRSDFEKEVILSVFQNIVSMFRVNLQIIHKKIPLDFSEHINLVKVYTEKINENDNLKKYGEIYSDYVSELAKDKLESYNYIAIRTDSKCPYADALSYLESVINQIEQQLESVNMNIDLMIGDELQQLFHVPEFVKEEVDYTVFGNELKRTYIITDYPRLAHPNWLKPILNFKYPIEITQHLTPFDRDSVAKNLEMTITKFESTMMIQQRNGMVISSELQVRYEDAKDLLERLVSGKDNIYEVGFYITITADSIDQLSSRSFELESALRSINVKFRRARKEMNKAIRTMFPLCHDTIKDTYTFDTKSLSTIIPFTAQDYTNKDGVLFGITPNNELITLDRHALANPNAVLLGVSGYGKSTLAKLDIGRHLLVSDQCFVIDHNNEYKELCQLFGGQYVTDVEKVNWDNQLIVFGIDKVKALRKIWYHITDSRRRSRLLVIDEFHNILMEDKDLMVRVIREIRKFGTAPTLITQNIREFLRSDEGKEIIDNCSIKILMRQGDNDMEEAERLFDLSKAEKMYLKTCKIGQGYIKTDLFSSRFATSFSAKESNMIETNPRRKVIE